MLYNRRMHKWTFFYTASHIRLRSNLKCKNKNAKFWYRFAIDFESLNFEFCIVIFNFDLLILNYLLRDTINIFDFFFLFRVFTPRAGLPPGVAGPRLRPIK